jgi:hypothetical protein
MKSPNPLKRALLLIMLLAPPAHAAFYESLDLLGSKDILIGLRVHTIPEVVGTMESISGTTLTDNHVNFDVELDVFTPYVIELEGGPVDGKVVKISTWAGNNLFVSESLPGATGIDYLIRPMPKLSEVIAPLSPLTTDDFNPDNADLVLIPAGNGEFDRYFMSSHPTHSGYFNVETGQPADPYLLYTDGMLYLRRDPSTTALYIAGNLKTTNTSLTVTDKFTFFSSVYPVDLTLAVSSLANSLQWGTQDTADVIWLQDTTTGQSRRYFYSDGTQPGLTVGWRQIDAVIPDQNQANVEFSPGFILQRRGTTPVEILVTVPPSYP